MPITCDKCGSEFFLRLVKQTIPCRGSLFCPVCGKKVGDDMDMANAVLGI